MDVNVTAALQVADGEGSRPLNVADLSAAETGSATEATLADVLAKLVEIEGNTDATVTLPPDRWLTRIRVVAGLTEAATVKIGGGLVIPVPPGDVLDIPIHGRVNDQDGDVIEISGVVRSYYVAWR